MRSPVPAPSLDLELSAPLLAACQARIAALWGVHFPPARWRDLTRHLRLVADELQLSLPACVSALLQDTPPPSLIALCVREFTVGETYFLRDADFFEKLSQAVLAPLIARRRAAGDLRLKLWSAGCCSGEEAYTLAILVAELIPDPERWQLQIIASDLNPEFLAAARRGRFGSWSFRQANEDWRRRHFVEEGHSRWRIQDEYRRHLTFLEHNLIRTDFPDSSRGLVDCDLILCRNVLMYFTEAQAVGALQRLLRCLEPDGALFMGAAEGMLCQWAGIKAELWSGALRLHQQTSADKNTVSRFATQSHTQLSSLPAQTRVPTTPSAKSNAVRDLAVPIPTASPPSSAKQKALAAANTARVHANLHQLQEALDWTQHALALDKLDPGHYWLLASLQIEQGAPAHARTTLRKAIYLQPDFIMAHYLSGLLNATLGEPTAAIRDLKNCIRLLEQLSDDSPLPESEGLSVMDLKKLALTSLERCRNGT